MAECWIPNPVMGVRISPPLPNLKRESKMTVGFIALEIQENIDWIKDNLDFPLL